MFGFTSKAFGLWFFGSPSSVSTLGIPMSHHCLRYSANLGYPDIPYVIMLSLCFDKPKVSYSCLHIPSYPINSLYFHMMCILYYIYIYISHYITHLKHISRQTKSMSFILSPPVTIISPIFTSTSHFKINRIHCIILYPFITITYQSNLIHCIILSPAFTFVISILRQARALLRFAAQFAMA